MDRPSAAGTNSRDAVAGLVYDGKLSELFGIFLFNLPLTIITFGIFHCWTVTRMRRYMWSHMRFEGTPFRYTGRGKEMLQGFVLALLILILLFASAAVAEEALKKSHPIQARLPFATAFVGMVVLFGATRFASLRYRLSHTEWCGISGGIYGSALRYGASWMIYLLVCVLTFAQAVPWMQVGLARSRIDASHFGSAEFHWDGRGWPLYLSWLAMMFGHIVLFGVIVAIVAGFEAPWLAHVLLGKSSGPIAHSVAFQVTPAAVGGLVFMVGSAILVTSYQAKCRLLILGNITAIVRGRFRNETLQFGTTAEVDGLTWLVFTNLAIMMLSLGLGLPIVLHRNASFTARTTYVTGIFDANTLAQGTMAPATFGNGFVQTLDPGMI
ncbi:MAG TPA: DUF898 family protein [Acetobacteraceae bacterium]|jgi:uncharacterized membrane protein YjgN (DUF898 family)|nr:DUF898 family protein [Acetobacteraceae bacterium]